MVLFLLDYPEKVIVYERKGFFDKAAELCYQRWKICPSNLAYLVSAGAQMWYTSYLIDVNKGDPNSVAASFPDQDVILLWLEEITQYGFDNFTNITEFNVIFGYMARTLPDQFGDYLWWYDKGNAMIQKAYHDAPDNLIAKAMYYSSIDDKAYRAVCTKIWERITPAQWGKSEVQQYFFRILCGNIAYPGAYEVKKNCLDDSCVYFD